MAQLNITLDQEEILQLLSEDRDGAFRKLLQESLNSVMKVESREQLKASPYERTEERTDSRNGFRERELTTRIGKIELNVPRHRNKPFKTMIFDNYSRSEAALISSMAEMVVNGVSTRKVTRVVEAICGETVSKSAVSDLCRDLDKPIEEFRNRPLTGQYPFVILDATYFKVRENNRVISKAMMIACATNEDGHREIIGFSPYRNESKETWCDFLRNLKKRGLKDVLMFTSDAHEGMLYAINREFPEVPWQRCQVHFSRNIVDKTPKKYQVGLRSELTEMFRCDTLEAARRKRDQIIADYQDVAESAMNCLDIGFEESMTVMALPKPIRVYYRSTNHIERVNRELKRRSKAIGIFANEASLVRIMGAVLIEGNEICLNIRKLFSKETFKSMMNSNTKQKLIMIAEEQAALIAA